MEWSVEFYRNNKGDEPARTFLESLDPSEQSTFETRVTYVKMKGPRVKNDVMTNVQGVKGLYRLRIKSENNPRFLLCAVAGRRFFVLHGFKEKDVSDYKKAVKKAIPRQKAVQRAYG